MMVARYLAIPRLDRRSRGAKIHDSASTLRMRLPLQLPIKTFRGALLTLLVISASSAIGQRVTAQQLVNEVAANELKADEEDTSLWMYSARIVKGGKTETRTVVETKQGDLSRLVAVNGTPLGASERKRENDRIKQLVSDPSETEKLKHDAEEDDKKARELLNLIRQAFLFKYASAQDRNIQLTYRPNPAFKPQSREAQVLHAMAGTMVINAKEERLEGIRGRMISDVDFGGGILGHLHQGGTFTLLRKEITQGRWQSTLIDVHLKGKALLFKTITEQQHELRSSFRRVPDDTNLLQAVQMLNGHTTAANARVTGFAENGLLLTRWGPNMQLTSAAYGQGDLIPRRFTCDGENISPEFSWRDAPKEAKSFVLTIHDPDAPGPEGFAHWVVYNIAPNVASVAPAVPKEGVVTGLGMQGRNDSGKIGYMGPCPPSGRHRYFTRLYALRDRLELQPGATYAEVMAAIQGKIIAVAELMGTYSRSQKPADLSR